MNKITLKYNVLKNKLAIKLLETLQTHLHNLQMFTNLNVSANNE